MRGLIVNRWMNAGILIDDVTGSGPTNNLIAGNFIGTNAAGSVGLANGHGVVISAPGNIVGGTTPAARNLISGNTGEGISLKFDDENMNNLIQGNYIGTDKFGTSALGNSRGIVVQIDGNQIGGSEPGAGNVISGNSSVGISDQWRKPTHPGQFDRNQCERECRPEQSERRR